MRLLRILYGLGLIFAPLTAAQRIVYTTSTSTVTELVVCTTTQYTTTILDFCPCRAIFPAITPCTSCQTCSTTIVSTTAPPNPPNVDGFTVDLTIDLASSDERVTLSRVGNTVGIGGAVLTFNLSDTGLLRDVLTGDIVYVILPTRALHKRFEGSVDLLIGPTPPASASTMTWYRNSRGELGFQVGRGTRNPITLGFGVALTDDEQIDTTVPIQMYDVSEGVPTDIETGVATQSSVTGGQPITRSGEQPSTISSTSSKNSSDKSSSSSSSSSSENTDKSVTTRTFTITQYGPTPGVSTSTVGSEIVYIIIIRLQATRTSTLYGPTATISTNSFDQYDPTITVFDIFSQVITTYTIYGSIGYTSTPTIGSTFPTLTAVAELAQITITNTTYGPQLSTISLEVNSTAPTITVYLQFTATTTITTTTYIWNQFPIITTTLYGTLPTATILILDAQYRVYTTVTDTFDLTTTIGPDNPTATVSVFISPNVTVTAADVTMNWNFTSGQSSIETPPQTPGYTRTVILHIAYPPASYVRFQPSDANPAMPQYFAMSTTSLQAYDLTALYLVTRPITKCMFIFVDGQLILATNPDTGVRLPYPGRLWSLFSPVEPSGRSLFLFVLDPVFQGNSAIRDRLIPVTTISANSNLLTVQSTFTADLLVSDSANVYYDAATGAVTGDSYTLRLISTEEVVAATTGRRNSLLGTTMISFTSTAPTA